jgi:hypothetical protein
MRGRATHLLLDLHLELRDLVALSAKAAALFRLRRRELHVDEEVGGGQPAVGRAAPRWVQTLGVSANAGLATFAAVNATPEKA